jgi:hypothetical protein
MSLPSPPLLLTAILMGGACSKAPLGSPGLDSRATPPTVGETPPTSARPAAHRPVPAAEVRPFGESICLNVKFAQGQPEEELSTLEDLGVHWVRDGVLWRDIEVTPGVFGPFPSAFTRRLVYYRKHGMGLVFILGYANSAAYPPTADAPLRPIDPSALARYAVEIARRLKESGTHFVLEIWNEPHNFVIRQLVGGAWNGAPPSPWIQYYVRMVDEVTARVKAIDPSITLLDDEDMWVLHYRFLEAGLPAALDGFAFHPYTKFRPERTVVTPDTNRPPSYVCADPDSSFESAVRRLRDEGAKTLAAPPQMWVTEWGWKLGSSGPDGPITEDTLVAYLPRAYILAANAGVRDLCWFSSEDSVDGPMGLMTNNGLKRKPYFAFRAMTKELGALEFVRQVAGSGHRTSGFQAFLFCQPCGLCKLAIWNVDEGVGRFRLVGTLATARAMDALGSPVTPERAADGAAAISVGQAPIYLDGFTEAVAQSPAFLAAVAELFE